MHLNLIGDQIFLVQLMQILSFCSNENASIQNGFSVEVKVAHLEKKEVVVVHGHALDRHWHYI